PLGVVDHANRWFRRWARHVEVAATHICASHDQTRFRSKSARLPVPYLLSAPFGPDAFGRRQIQFSQADSRPKILLVVDSPPANRRLASIPDSASGENPARSETSRRISSAQSRSSGVAVTRPRPAASAAASSLPLAASTASSAVPRLNRTA